jgi:hypothetical protein
MKKVFLLFVLFAAMVSCGKGDEPKPEPKPNPDTPSTQTSISISPSALTFDAQGETKSVTVTCTTGKTWTLSGGESWCTASGTNGANGANGATVTFTAEANTSPDERNATYTFTCGDKTAKLVVTQKQQDALTVTSSKVEVDAQGGPINVEVKANIPFEYVIADKDKGWITPVKTKSMQTTVLTFNIAQNEDREKREGSITIKSGELSETITVYQAGAQPTIVITRHTYEVSSKGETIKVEINSNVEFSISIPAAYSAWIQEAAEPRALSTHTKYFTISANLETHSRSGKILFTSQEHNLTEKVTIQQKAIDADVTTVHVPTKGTLASVLAENNLETSSIVLLKITGELDEDDFRTIRKMRKLKSLDLSRTTITEVPAKACYEALNIQNILLPNTLEVINEQAFEFCGFQTVKIPASVKTIRPKAFCDNRSLVSIIFEQGSQLETIERYVFSYCSCLQNIEIPANVETIGDGPFSHCTSLTNVTFEQGSQLNTINDNAFQKCSSLKTIDMSTCTKVKIIGSAVIDECHSLQTFELGTHTPPDVSYLSSTPISATLQVPAESVDAYKKAYGWKDFPHITSLD